MILERIEISNYKSIQSVVFKIEKIADSYTYTLLGINESGKSSFLKAISLFDEGHVSYPLDYFDEAQEIEIKLVYKIETSELKEIKDLLATDFKFEKALLQEIEIEEVIIQANYSANSTAEKTISEIVKFKKSLFSNYMETETESGIVIQKKGKSDIDIEDLDLDEFFNRNFEDYFWNISHRVVLWKSNPAYLILDEIDLTTFSSTPKGVSIPLANCFNIAGVKNLKSEIAKLTTPVAIQNLEDILSDKVTEHINQVWPEHPIRIKFKINNNKLTFLVEDKDVKYKVKTTGQRSDGFRQFISFLLTLSAENHTDELSNTIMLIDEPEVHLHPNAQLNLTKELIKISQSGDNNIVIFATHSNYMIDKDNIDRCYKVTKKKNATTLEKIEHTHTSYAEVNFEVFEILTNDYHNELYGYLEDVAKQKLNAIEKNKKWANEKTGKTEDVSLPTYIRHSIHHPENTSNKKFTEAELRKSIQILRDLKSNLSE